MKYKKIVGFGDSWMWGDELLNPELKDHPHAHPVFHENTPYRESHCFLGLLGKHYGVPTENFGIAGGSLQSAIWTYLWWIEHEQLSPEDCLILVGHTDPNRHSFYNPNHASYDNDPPWNKFVHNSWVHAGADCCEPDWVNLVKLHTVLTDSQQQHRLNAHQSLRFFDGQSCALGHNVIQFYTMQAYYPIDTLPSLYRPSGSLHDLVRDNKSLLAPDGHPNELGHRVIADQLIEKIDQGPAIV